jgi:hypothetical protein
MNKHVPTFKQFLNEKVKLKEFRKGGKVKVHGEEYGQLNGKIGEVVDIEPKEKRIAIDFGEYITETGKGTANFETNNLEGKLSDNTGLYFFEDNAVGRFFGASEFSIKDLEIVE